MALRREDLLGKDHHDVGHRVEDLLLVHNQGHRQVLLQDLLVDHRRACPTLTLLLHLLPVRVGHLQGLLVDHRLLLKKTPKRTNWKKMLRSL